jgi:ABC-type multidrug transport system ATPase subunit
MEASITFKNVCKRYNNNSVLSDLSLGIEKGTTFTIIGKDGAGRSTLLKIIAGLTAIDSGSVYVQGREVTQNTKEVRQNIGYLPPQNIHDPWISGNSNIEKYYEYSDIESHIFQKRYEYFSDLFEIKDYLAKKPNKYPDGVKRRLDLILVLIQDPDILLLDEPLKDLDYHIREILLKYLKDVKTKKTTVITTNEFTEIETVTDRWIVLHNGSIRYDGDLETMLTHVDLNFTGYLEIKENNRGKIIEQLHSKDNVRSVKNLGNTIQVETKSALSFFKIVEELGESNFYRIAGNSVNMNYLLDQLTSEEGLE